MLSNNFLNRLMLILLLAGIISCSEKQEPIPVLDYNNKAQLLEIVKKNYNKDVSVAIGGMFDETGKNFIAAGTEINNSDDWGIRFTFLEKSGDDFIKKYETDLLDGSFKECLVDKIQFSSIDYDLVYYNSQNFFLGSGGGEIISYLVDFENKQVYYAHLVVESQSGPSLFISDNTENKELVNFFTLTFKKDYPSVKIVKDDIVTE